MKTIPSYQPLIADSKTELLRDQINKSFTLTAGEFEKITSHLKYREVKKHQFLLLEGDPCYNDFFVVNGALRQYHIHEGAEFVTQFAFEGWWLTDLSSLFDENSNRYYIQALEDTEVLQIDKDELKKLFHEVPGFERFYLKTLQRAFAVSQRRVSSLQKSHETSYLDFMKIYGYYGQRLSQADIAAYLGVTIESLSRISHNTFEKNRMQ